MTTLRERLDAVQAGIDALVLERGLGYLTEIDEPDHTVLIHMPCEEGKTGPVFEAAHAAAEAAGFTILGVRISKNRLRIVVSSI